MTPHEIEQALKRLGDGMAIAVDNLHVAADHVTRFPLEYFMAAANVKIAATLFDSGREQIVALLMKSDPAQSGSGALHILTHDIEKLVLDAKNLAEHLVLTGERGPQPAYALDLHVRTERTVREVFERATGLHDRLIHFRFANGCMNCTPSASHPSEINTNKECCLHA